MKRRTLVIAIIFLSILVIFKVFKILDMRSVLISKRQKVKIEDKVYNKTTSGSKNFDNTKKHKNVLQKDSAVALLSFENDLIINNLGPDKEKSFPEILKRMEELILDESISNSDYYPKGEMLYLKIRKEILSGNLSHKDVVDFFHYLLSIGTERAVAMAISLGVLSADSRLLDEIYNIYLESDRYTQRFILDRLKEVNIAKELGQILQNIDSDKYDRLFSQYLLKGMLINQAPPEVIGWLQKKIALAQSRDELESWLFTISYIGNINSGNFDSVASLIRWLCEENNNLKNIDRIVSSLGARVSDSSVLLYMLQVIGDNPSIALPFVQAALRKPDIRADIIDELFYYQRSLTGYYKDLFLRALHHYYKLVGREQEYLRMVEKAVDNG